MNPLNAINGYYYDEILYHNNPYVGGGIEQMAICFFFSSNRTGTCGKVAHFLRIAHESSKFTAGSGSTERKFSTIQSSYNNSSVNIINNKIKYLAMDYCRPLCCLKSFLTFHTFYTELMVYSI